MARLTYSEAERVAEDVKNIWDTIIGGPAPAPEAIADLVQRIDRKSDEMIAAREDSDV